jgi:hypothetical protein
LAVVREDLLMKPKKPSRAGSNSSADLRRTAGIRFWSIRPSAVFGRLIRRKRNETVRQRDRSGAHRAQR